MSIVELFRVDEEAWSRFTATSPDEQGRWHLLQSVLNLSSVNDNPRALIVFEFIYNVLQYCCDSKFSFPQTSVVLTVFGEVFDLCFVANGGKSREDAIAIFTAQISQLALNTPDGGPSVALGVESIRGITNLFSDTVVKHFDMYLYVMHELPVEFVEDVKVIVQTPVSSLPRLSEGEHIGASPSHSVTAATQDEIEGQDD